MTTMSLGLRSSGSYGSLQQQVQNGVLAIQTTPPLAARKPSKMIKGKESLFHWICKFAGRKKVGMLLLCAVSAAVFVWVLYVGKGLMSHLFYPFSIGCALFDFGSEFSIYVYVCIRICSEFNIYVYAFMLAKV